MMANAISSSAPDTSRFHVNALQFDLLDNRPAVHVRNVVTGEVLTLRPQTILDAVVPVDHQTVYAAAYLQGYSDRHFDEVLCQGLSNLVQRMRALHDAEVAS